MDVGRTVKISNYKSSRKFEGRIDRGGKNFHVIIWFIIIDFGKVDMYNKNIRSKWNFRYLDVGKGKKIMFFIYEKNEYHVNTKDEFTKATPDDYIDMLDAFGIVLHSLSDNPEFGNSTVMLMLDNNGRITIEVVDEKEDDYKIIDPTYAQEECKEIKEFLKFE